MVYPAKSEISIEKLRGPPADRRIVAPETQHTLLKCPEAQPVPIPVKSTLVTGAVHKGTKKFKNIKFRVQEYWKN